MKKLVLICMFLSPLHVCMSRCAEKTIDAEQKSWELSLRSILISRRASGRIRPDDSARLEELLKKYPIEFGRKKK